MKQKLVRLEKQSRRLDFVYPIRCDCGEDNLYVIDHRSSYYQATANREWRYEVTCDACRQCDPDGYQNRNEVIEAYPPNVES